MCFSPLQKLCMRNFINHFSWKKKLTNYIVLPLFEHNGFLEFISSVVFHQLGAAKIVQKVIYKHLSNVA